MHDSVYMKNANQLLVRKAGQWLLGDGTQGRERWKGEIKKGPKDTLRVVDVFIILLVVMVSWMGTSCQNLSTVVLQICVYCMSLYLNNIVNIINYIYFREISRQNLKKLPTCE